MPCSSEQPPSKGRRAAIFIKNWFLAAPIRFLILPWIVGIVWHGLHPIASVLTGDLKRARRWYIDENSLEPSHFTMNAPYDLILQTKYNPKKYNRTAEETVSTIQSLCHGLQQAQQESVHPTPVPCHRHSAQHDGRTFEIAKIVPLSAGITPVSEAIVLIVPPFLPFSASRIQTRGGDGNEERRSKDKSRSQFQASLLQLVRRLSSPQTAPWLTKTVFVVSSVGSNTTSLAVSASLSPILEETVQSFLDAYLGKMPVHQQDHDSYHRRPKFDERLPSDFTGALIRNLIVLDLELFQSDNRPLPMDETQAYEPETSELRILPQGRRGVLPNMDLTFAVRAIYDRTSPMLGQQQLHPKIKQKYKLVEMVVHPHSKKAKVWWTWLKDRGLPEQLHDWANKMLQLLSFEYVMALGPYPPHAPALDRGIDALTIQGVFVSATDEDDFDIEQGNIPRSKLSPQQYPLELVQKMEYVIRSLSNLHERLHHSTSLYLLPSTDRFIKHEEYLVPNLLLVVPLILRALLIVFHQDTDRQFRPDLTAAGQALAICLAWTVTFSLLALHITSTPSETKSQDSVDLPRLIWFCINYQPLLVYLLMIFLALTLSRRRLLARRLEQDLNARRSIQMAACLLAACIHIAIAFGHVSLAFPSALWWAPLLAFPAQAESGVVDDKGRRKASRARTLVRCVFKFIVFVATCPFVFLVPHVFTTYTIYVRFAYVPLHMLFSILLLLPESAL